MRLSAVSLHSHRDRSRGAVLGQLVRQQLTRGADSFEALAGDLADGGKVKTVTQASVPVAVLLALLAALGDLLDAVAGAADLDRLREQAGRAEVVEVDGVGEEFRFVENGRALRKLLEDARRLIEKLFGGDVADLADEHLGGEVGAVFEARAAQLSGGEE